MTPGRYLTGARTPRFALLAAALGASLGCGTDKAERKLATPKMSLPTPNNVEALGRSPAAARPAYQPTAGANPLSPNTSAPAVTPSPIARNPATMPLVTNPVVMAPSAGLNPSPSYTGTNSGGLPPAGPKDPAPLAPPVAPPPPSIIVPPAMPGSAN